MTYRKWLLATATLAVALTTSAFAENQAWGRDGDHRQPEYSQRSDRDRGRTYARNDGYRNQDRDRDDRGRYVRRDNDQYRDHGRYDRDDRDRDRH